MFYTESHEFHQLKSWYFAIAIYSVLSVILREFVRSRIHIAIHRNLYWIWVIPETSQANAPQTILWLSYCAMIHFIITNAYLAWRNSGKCDFSLIQFEKRICKRFCIRPKISSLHFCSSTAQSLAEKAPLYPPLNHRWGVNKAIIIIITIFCY